MRLLDLFCGAGGAAEGYRRAGFDRILGIDIDDQPRYPFNFYRADALEVLDHLADFGEFDAIHASPPCQLYSKLQILWNREHPDLIAPVRDRLVRLGTPWVIENVPGAPLRRDLELCGSMFGLQVKRHRYFEFGSPLLILAPPCDHRWKGGRAVGVYGHTGGTASRGASGNKGWMVADWRRAMGIPWMVRDELAEAIPPAYTEFIGRHLIASLSRAAA